MRASSTRSRHDYDYVIQVDGDGQHCADEIEKLVDAMHEDPTLDMVCGSRFLTKELGYPAPISRRTGIHLFAFLLSRIIGQRVSDPTSGFRLYNRRGIALFARDYPHDYPEVEAVLMVHFHRLRMKRGPGAHAPARRRRIVDPLGEIRLLHDQGAARRVHRLGAQATRPEPAAVTRRSRPRTGSDGSHGSRSSPSPRARSCCFVVLELVRRRAFLERYALLWLFSGLVLLALSIWKGALENLAQLVGIAYPPNALFLVAFGFVLILLLHFSLAVSRLSDQTKVLAQRLALLEQRQEKTDRRGGAGRRARGRLSMTSVAVVGLGRVGLPLALSFADRGLDVDRSRDATRPCSTASTPVGCRSTRPARRSCSSACSRAARFELTRRVRDAAARRPHRAHARHARARPYRDRHVADQQAV